MPRPFSRASSGVGALGETERAGVTFTRPRSQHQQQASPGHRDDLTALLRSELEQRPRAAFHSGTAATLDRDLAGNHDEPGAFVDLVVMEPLTGEELKRDHARGRGRGKDPRGAGSGIEASHIPALHGQWGQVAERPAELWDTVAPRFLVAPTTGPAAVR